MDKTTVLLISVILAVGLIAGVFLQESMTGSALFDFKKTAISKEQTLTKTQCLDKYSPWTRVAWKGVSLDPETLENTFEHQTIIQFPNQETYLIKFTEIDETNRAKVVVSRFTPTAGTSQTIYLTQNTTYNYSPTNVRTLQIKADNVINNQNDLEDILIISHRFI